MTGKEFISAWENGSASYKKAENISQISITFLVGLGLGCFTAAVSLILKQDVSDSEVCKRVHNSIISAFVMIALAWISGEVCAFCFPTARSEWLIKNNVKLSRCIKEIRGFANAPKLSRERREYEKISTALFLAASPRDVNDRYIMVIFFGMCAAAIAICAGLCAVENADEWIRYIVDGGEFTFKYGALIPAVFFTAVYIVLSVFIRKTFLKRKAKWINSFGL
ncbi:MAG: hypothetical protein K2N22_05995 [Clostridia bacterium]|nr:hypothetical protein [Clostridia bacterium]